MKDKRGKEYCILWRFGCSPSLGGVRVAGLVFVSVWFVFGGKKTDLKSNEFRNTYIPYLATLRYLHQIRPDSVM